MGGEGGRLDTEDAHEDDGEGDVEGDGEGVAGVADDRVVDLLFFQAGECQHFSIGDKTAACQAGTQLADQHFLSQHLAELQAAVAQLTNYLVKTLGTELAVDLEFRCQQDHLVQSRFGESELRIMGALQQQFAARFPECTLPFLDKGTQNDQPLCGIMPALLYEE